jgi:hypothetical protein
MFIYTIVLITKLVDRQDILKVSKSEHLAIIPFSVYNSVTNYISYS